MSFLLAVDNDQAYLYDYTHERHDQLQKAMTRGDWHNIFVCTLTKALQIGFAPPTPDGKRRRWMDLTSGGMIVKPYMDHVKRWLEQEITDEYTLNVTVDQNVTINIHDFNLAVETDVTVHTTIVDEFVIRVGRCPQHVFDQHCESLTRHFFHLPNRIEFGIWDDDKEDDGYEACRFDMQKTEGFILAELAPSTGVWKTLRSMIDDLSYRKELRTEHVSREGQLLDMAWAMVSHRRLGAASPASGLSDDMISMMLERTEWDNPLLDLLDFDQEEQE
jgi:hypothetical protein